jgi:hypothetical protein
MWLEVKVSIKKAVGQRESPTQSMNLQSYFCSFRRTVEKKEAREPTAERCCTPRAAMERARKTMGAENTFRGK